MKFKSMWKSFIIIIVFLQGCATTRIALNSIEIPSEITSDQITKSRVSIMPVAGTINSKENTLLFKKGLIEFINYTSKSDTVIGPEEVESVMLEHPELLSAYEAILKGLVDYEQILIREKEDGVFKVENEPWDGEKGVNYKNISALYTGKEKADNDNLKVSLDWLITIKKKINNRSVLLSPVEMLSNTLNSDYLLIPVILDKYHYVKELGICLFIPFMYTYHLNYSKDIALYLIDGKSAKIVKATVGNNLSPVLVAASLQRILEKGKFAGKISLEKK